MTRHPHHAPALAALALWLLATPTARADDLVDLELTLPLALAERSSTGTGAELAGYGYDVESGLIAGGEARLYARGFGRYLRIGVAVGAQHHAGPLLGLVDGHAFRTTVVDAGVAVRTLFPCMSNRDMRWHLAGVLAMSGVVADAGEGVGAMPNGPRYVERVRASESLDHGGLGWRLGVDLSVHLQSFVVGLALGVRQYFGLEGPVSRGLLTDVGLRLGGRIDFADGD